MPITPKSIEEILQTSWEAWDKDEYGNVYIHDKWVKQALASHLLWAAETLPHIAMNLRKLRNL